MLVSRPLIPAAPKACPTSIRGSQGYEEDVTKDETEGYHPNSGGFLLSGEGSENTRSAGMRRSVRAVEFGFVVYKKRRNSLRPLFRELF